jgi:hypothetical protein
MKKIVILVIVFLFVGLGFQPAFANDNNITVSRVEQQPRGVTFYKTFGGLFSDSGNYVQQTSDGGFIIVGEKGSVVWLLKTNSNGSMMWDKTFNGLLSNRYFGLCVQQTTDGGYIIAGYRYSSILQEGGIWLIKTDSAGNKLWVKTFGEWDLDWDEGCCVQQTSDGGYILTGSKTEPFPSYKAVWLIKTDSNGNMEWNKTFERAGYDFGYFVQQTFDGGYIIIGLTVIFDWQVWLIKTDNVGNMEWDKTFGVNDFCYCVQQTTDGGYILTGVTCSFGAGKDDVWLIKTDSNGSIMWDKTLGGSDSDWGYFVQQTSDGGYIITI